MLESLSQYSDLSFLVLRLVIALVFIVHAMPKLKNPKMMAQGMGWPDSAVLALGTVEFVSSLGMIFGVYIRVAALLLVLVMCGALYMKTQKWSVPFTALDKTGWEFDLTLLAANILILVNGGGVIAIQ